MNIYRLFNNFLTGLAKFDTEYICVMSLSSYECHEDMYTERSTLPKGVNKILLLNYIFSPDFGINRQRKPPRECMKCFLCSKIAVP